MKTTKKYTTSIGDLPFDVNDEKTHVFYGGKWRKLKSDYLGDKYFDFNGKQRWLDSSVIGN